MEVDEYRTPKWLSAIIIALSPGWNILVAIDWLTNTEGKLVDWMLDSEEFSLRRLAFIPFLILSPGILIVLFATVMYSIHRQRQEQSH